MSHGNADAGLITPQSTFYDEGRFGRMFPSLPPFSADTPSIRAALREVGKPGGIMDAGDDLTNPLALIVDPVLSSANPNNPTMTAGFTFVGQFLDHDMTFDPTSSLARRQDPESIRNFRIPALDLDSVYGGGPGVSPHLYDQTVDGGRTTFLVEEIPGSAAVTCDGTPRYDVPRNSQNVALIADPRNDENLIVSQLQLALLRFHNAVLADVKSDLGTAYTLEEIFAEAQRVVRWHYQWMIVHEFLPATIGASLTDDILTNGRTFYGWRNAPYIPDRVLRRRLPLRPLAGAPQLPRQLRHRRGRRRAAVLRPLLQAGRPQSRRPRRPARRVPRLAPLRRLADLLRLRRRARPPQQAHRHDAVEHPLPPHGAGLRDPRLARDPQPRALADDEGAVGSVGGQGDDPAPLAPADLADLGPHHLEKRTPLWFYILREADVQAGGQHLGAVGGRIVGEVILGLLEGDSQSYLSQDPEWSPTYGTAAGFGMTDLLLHAGVVGAL